MKTKIQEDGLNPSVRRFNQHFLTDESVLEAMILSSDIGNEDIVLEIGPGMGNLTRRLAEVAKLVVAVEYDKRLEDDLDRITSSYPNVEIIYGNALKIKFPKADRIVSNIPFNATEPLISKLFLEKFKSATLLVGETYGKQATSDCHPSRIGLLTRAYFETDYVRDVPSICFVPEPATNGSIIKLYPVNKNHLKNDFRRYVIRCIWDQRTRPLRDALPAAIFQYINIRGGNNFSQDSFLEQVRKNYIHSLNVRVDKLTNTEFLDLYEVLRKVNLKKAFEGHKPRGGGKNWRKEFREYL